VVGDDDAEHGVAEELEALVGLPAGVLGAPGPVDDRRCEQRSVVDRPPEAVVQIGEPIDRDQRNVPPQPVFATT
jgi:hypothetical protein